MATFPEVFNGLFFRLMLGICLQNLTFVALPIPEIIAATPQKWAIPGYAHAPFLPNFLMGFFRMDFGNIPAKSEVHSCYY